MSHLNICFVLVCAFSSRLLLRFSIALGVKLVSLDYIWIIFSIVGTNVALFEKLQYWEVNEKKRGRGLKFLSTKLATSPTRPQSRLLMWTTVLGWAPSLILHIPSPFQKCSPAGARARPWLGGQFLYANINSTISKLNG